MTELKMPSRSTQALFACWPTSLFLLVHFTTPFNDFLAVSRLAHFESLESFAETSIKQCFSLQRSLSSHSYNRRPNENIARGTLLVLADIVGWNVGGARI